MANETYFLMPGCQIGKKGLPGGKLTCKEGTDPKKIEEKHAKVIENNIPYFLSKKTLITGADLIAMQEKAEKEAEADKNKKSDKRTILEAEATELEIEFTTKTSNKDLEAAIKSKNAENQKLDDLMKQAKELELTVPDGTTTVELEEMVKKALED